jgi:hypothetical protein
MVITPFAYKLIAAPVVDDGSFEHPRKRLKFALLRLVPLRHHSQPFSGQRPIRYHISRHNCKRFFHTNSKIKNKYIPIYPLKIYNCKKYPLFIKNHKGTEGTHKGRPNRPQAEFSVVEGTLLL